MKTRFVLVISSLTLVFAACAGGDDVGSPDATFAPTETERTDQSIVVDRDLPEQVESQVAAVGEVPGGIMAIILADAEERVGIPQDDLEVTVAEAVVWSDGSLGCPQPGSVYTQALIDGFRVVVESATEQTDYHVAADGGFVVCENDGVTPAGLGRAGGGSDGDQSDE